MPAYCSKEKTILLEANERVLDCAAAECLFVDDNPANVAAAESVGVHGIRFTNAEGLVRELVEWGMMAQ